VEELYYTPDDPFQVRNLARSAEHRKVLEGMRGRLREWMEETRDLGFLPEGEVARRIAETAGTPYEIARIGAGYSPEKVRSKAARWVGTGAAARDRQAELLEDEDPAVRFWAAVGLHALGAGAAEAGEALAKALGDASAPVRIEAAATLCGLGRAEKALPVLEKELLSRDLRAALRAARALELLGETARPALPAMRKVYAAAQRGQGDSWMFLRFALEPALKNLEKKLEK
jgi:uncharacterized sulfatase